MNGKELAWCVQEKGGQCGWHQKADALQASGSVTSATDIRAQWYTELYLILTKHLLINA